MARKRKSRNGEKGREQSGDDLERAEVKRTREGGRDGMEARAFERYGLLSRRPSNQHCQLARAETREGGAQ